MMDTLGAEIDVNFLMKQEKKQQQEKKQKQEWLAIILIKIDIHLLFINIFDSPMLKIVSFLLKKQRSLL